MWKQVFDGDQKGFQIQDDEGNEIFNDVSITKMLSLHEDVEVIQLYMHADSKYYLDKHNDGKPRILTIMMMILIGKTM